LVAGPAAGDQTHLVARGVAAGDETVLLVEVEQQRVAEHEALEGLGDQVLRIVDDAATHGALLPGRGGWPHGIPLRPAPLRARASSRTVPGMRLLLIRHGQTPSNVEGILDAGYPGPGLTALGQ